MPYGCCIGGGNLTTGLPESIGICGRDIVEPIGVIRVSRLISWTREERRDIAMLGEYMLPPYTLGPPPPYMLVRREKPPSDPNVGRPLLLLDPNPC